MQVHLCPLCTQVQSLYKPLRWLGIGSEAQEGQVHYHCQSKLADVRLLVPFPRKVVSSVVNPLYSAHVPERDILRKVTLTTAWLPAKVKHIPNKFFCEFL